MDLMDWLICIPCAIYVWRCMPILYPPIVEMCMQHSEMTNLEEDDSFVNAAMFLDMNND